MDITPHSPMPGRSPVGVSERSKSLSPTGVISRAPLSSGRTDSSRAARALLAACQNNVDSALAAVRAAAAPAVSDSAVDTQTTHPAPATVAKSDTHQVIQVKAVSKNYKLGGQRVAALKAVDVTIRQGEFVAITGTSGSGKSTLLQLIGGLDKPSAGQVIINDQDISRLSDRQLSIFRNRTIGFVFQFFYLQPFLNTGANLEVPAMFARLKRSDRQARVRELAEAVGLSERLGHLPKQLSGGQMQRVAVARALLNKPKILLADEPTGNLDQANGTAIIDLFEQVRQAYGTTIVVVTHDRTIAARADREIALRDGEIIT